MGSFRGKGAAITGAASGIGRALAVHLAAEGCSLALSDIDAEGLAGTARRLAALGAPVDSERVDVADPDAVRSWADRVVTGFGPIHLVFNNAGVALNATVGMVSREDLEWVMRVNFWGVVHGTLAFLPHLRRQGEGCIVNMSSVLGLIAVPAHAAYSASKFAIRGFTEALRQELELERCGVSAILVHPAGVKTSLMRSSRMGGPLVLGSSHRQIIEGFDRLAPLDPDRAARTILRGVGKNRARILVGRDARLVDCVQRFFPTGYRRLVLAWVRHRRSGG